LTRLGHHSGACKGLLARSPAQATKAPPRDQGPLPTGFPPAAARYDTLRVPEAPIEAPSASLCLAPPPGNPLANAVSEHKPDRQSHRKIKYQGTHGHRPGNDNQIVSA